MESGNVGIVSKDGNLIGGGKGIDGNVDTFHDAREAWKWKLQTIISEGVNGNYDDLPQQAPSDGSRTI